jgi:uncharacterized protein YuzE
MAEALGSMDIQYDPSADVLYCSFGKPQEAIGEEVDEGIIVRRNVETNAIVGITVIDFSRRFSERPGGEVVSIPLDAPVQTVA